MCGWEENGYMWASQVDKRGKGRERDSRVQKLYNFKMSERVLNSKGKAWAGTLILEELEECVVHVKILVQQRHW